MGAHKGVCIMKSGQRDGACMMPERGDNAIYKARGHSEATQFRFDISDINLGSSDLSVGNFRRTAST